MHAAFQKAKCGEVFRHHAVDWSRHPLPFSIRSKHGSGTNRSQMLHISQRPNVARIGILVSEAFRKIRAWICPISVQTSNKMDEVMTPFSNTLAYVDWA